MYFFELGHVLRHARTDRSATQEGLARQTGLGRTTVNQLEAGVYPDLGVKKLMKLLDAVGLELTIVPASKRRVPDFLRMACTSANVTHREQLIPDELARAFLTGRVPAAFRPHLRVIFDEVPQSVLAGAIHQVSASAPKPERVMDHVRGLARSVGSELRIS